jgi:hypothetical protein
MKPVATCGPDEYPGTSGAGAPVTGAEDATLFGIAKF